MFTNWMQNPPYPMNAHIACLKSMTFILALCMFLLAFLGCASVGYDFNSQNVDSLELGRVRATDYQALFGRPNEVQSTNTDQGQFIYVSYGYGTASLGSDAHAKTLNLEFRNGMLNSYSYINTFEKAPLDLEKIKKIKIGASNKEDVMRILGKPSGMSLCPTLGIFKKVCGKGHEAWIWVALRQGHNGKTTSILVTFDDNGHVITTEESED